MDPLEPPPTDLASWVFFRHFWGTCVSWPIRSVGPSDEHTARSGLESRISFLKDKRKHVKLLLSNHYVLYSNKTRNIPKRHKSLLREKEGKIILTLCSSQGCLWFIADFADIDVCIVSWSLSKKLSPDLLRLIRSWKLKEHNYHWRIVYLINHRSLAAMPIVARG